MTQLDNRYLIIGYQRSGTTALHLILGGHPAISTFTGELREPYFSKGLTAFNAGYLSDAEQAHGHRLLFDAITGAHADDGTQLQGAKTVCNSPKAAEVIMRALGEHLPGMKIIIIERRDLVAQYGSQQMTKASGVYHSWQGKSEARQASVKIDRRLFKRYVLVVERTYAALQKLRDTHPVLHLTHESFLADNDGIYREALEFLGVDYAAPEWFGSKKVLPHASSYVQDYEELTGLLEDTREQLAAGTLSPREDQFLKVYTRARRTLW
ncbi:MAG: sulfotransferase [Pseudomonadota bacterium]